MTNIKLSLLFALSVASVYGNPFLKAAEDCTTDNCQIRNNCRCSSTIGPITDTENPSPQFILITISESVVQILYDDVLKPLFFDSARTNPDGSPVGLTFYVPHEYTDYALVQDLYVRGYEIADYSITRNANSSYWPLASLDDLIEEFGGQKQIITTFANISAKEITGARTPAQIKGDVSIEAYTQSELSYDNSWPTLSTHRIFPYTLDYASTQICAAAYECPEESHPGFWIVPITDIKGADDTECNSLATCLVQGSSDDIANWLMEQLNLVRESNRAPLTLRLDTYWFSFTENSFDGFTKFLNNLGEMDDVFMITAQDVIEWMKNPVPLSEYTVPDHSNRISNCLNITCKLTNWSGEDKYMQSCVSCPKTYPWKGNPLGE